MDEYTGPWPWWRKGFERFRPVFAEPGFRRFVEYVTGLVLDPEEHKVPQAATKVG